MIFHDPLDWILMRRTILIQKQKLFPMDILAWRSSHIYAAGQSWGQKFMSSLLSDAIYNRQHANGIASSPFP